MPVKFVDANTKIKATLFDPVVNKGYKVALRPLEEDVTVDRDERRSYDVPAIETMYCEIGKEARAWAAAANDRIFQISINYERCLERREESLFFSDEKVAVCRDLDAYEKPFDKEIYKAIMDSEHHGKRDDISWIPLLTDENSATEWAVISELQCDGRPDLWDWMRANDRSHRCLMSVDNSNPTHWQATTMHEVYQAGFFRDEIEAHLTSTRVFADLPAEKQAVADMLPGLQKMVDGIKAKIASRVAYKAAKDGAVSDLLGAGN